MAYMHYYVQRGRKGVPFTLKATPSIHKDTGSLSRSEQADVSSHAPVIVISDKVVQGSEEIVDVDQYQVQDVRCQQEVVEALSVKMSASTEEVADPKMKLGGGIEDSVSEPMVKAREEMRKLHEDLHDQGHPWRHPNAVDLSTNTSDMGRSPKPSDQAPDAEFWPLSGKPYFYVVLNQYHLANRFQLIIPYRITEKLPAAKVPAKIICRGKVWELFYLGNKTSSKRFEKQAWGKFATDNNLAVGDACVFELTEGISSDCSNIEFKVQILKNNFPSELLEKAEGYTENNPISID